MSLPQKIAISNNQIFTFIEWLELMRMYKYSGQCKNGCHGVFTTKPLGNWNPAFKHLNN